MLSKAVVIAASALVATADVYMHFPRGSNDRCDEKSNNRNNAQRQFNSQNNAAGGYGVCEGEMVFHPGSTLKIEYYSQHSCGNGDLSKKDPMNAESTICQQTLQLGCENTMGHRMFTGPMDTYGVHSFTDGVSLGRPGADLASELVDNPLAIYETFGSTCTQKAPRWEECAGLTEAQLVAVETRCNDLFIKDNQGTFNGNDAEDDCKCSTRKKKTYGYHESNYYWDLCSWRSRQKGLFTADKNPGPFAVNTRQQQNSARYGFECPEEREYYPYWAPTPWVDLAVFVSNKTRCDLIQKESQNVREKCWCMPSPLIENPTLDDIEEAHFYIFETDCEDAGHAWTCEAPWKTQMNVAEPFCDIAPAQPDNRLGNSNTQGIFNPKNDDTFAHFDWDIPKNFLQRGLPEGQDYLRCNIRLRYNISTGETPEEFDSSMDYTLKTNPVVSYGDAYDMEAETMQTAQQVMPVRMAINTAQYGRTFEDRSYIFKIAPRPAKIPNNAVIRNLNVRGKRGNIAQVRNCVEYDFTPLEMSASVGEWVHFQWCGTEYNNNGNAGEGRQGTDRSNIIPLLNYDANMPHSLNITNQIFDVADMRMIAYLNQTECYTVDEMLDKGKKGNSGNDPMSCHFLNGVRDMNKRPTGYFNHYAEIKRNGNFQFMSSRNNNFSNRSQKAMIAVGTVDLSTGAIAGIVIGVLVLLGLIGVGAALLATGKISLSKSSRV